MHHSSTSQMFNCFDNCRYIAWPLSRAAAWCWNGHSCPWQHDVALCLLQLHQAAVEYSGKGDNVHPEEPDNRFYLVNPEGEFVKAYPQSASTKEITDEMFEIIKSYSLNHATWHAPKKIARRHA